MGFVQEDIMVDNPGDIFESLKALKAIFTNTSKSPVNKFLLSICGNKYIRWISHIFLYQDNRATELYLSYLQEPIFKSIYQSKLRCEFGHICLFQVFSGVNCIHSMWLSYRLAAPGDVG